MVSLFELSRLTEGEQGSDSKNNARSSAIRGLLERFGHARDIDITISFNGFVYKTSSANRYSNIISFFQYFLFSCFYKQ